METPCNDSTVRHARTRVATAALGIAMIATATAVAAPAHARAGGTTQLTADASAEPGGVSRDGRYVSYSVTDPTSNMNRQVFVHDTRTGQAQRIAGDRRLYGPNALSGDGRYVAVWDASGIVQVDRQSGRTRQVVEGFATIDDVSANGRFVAYRAAGAAPGTVDVYVWDRRSGTSTRITGGQGSPGRAAISDDGQRVALALTSNADEGTPTTYFPETGVYLYDRFGNSFETVAAGPVTADPDLSTDGNVLSFVTAAALTGDDTDTEPDTYVWQRGNGATSLVPGFGETNAASLSATGRYLATETRPSGGGHEIWRYDRLTGVSVPVTGGEATGERPVIAGNGRSVVFRGGGLHQWRG